MSSANRTRQTREPSAEPGSRRLSACVTALPSGSSSPSLLFPRFSSKLVPERERSSQDTAASDRGNERCGVVQNSGSVAFCYLGSCSVSPADARFWRVERRQRDRARRPRCRARLAKPPRPRCAARQRRAALPRGRTSPSARSVTKPCARHRYPALTGTASACRGSTPARRTAASRCPSQKYGQSWRPRAPPAAFSASASPLKKIFHSAKVSQLNCL